MKRPVIESFDDYEYAEHKALIPATRTDIPMSFDGQTVTLDLTDESYEIVAKLARAIMDMGTAKTVTRSHRATGQLDRRPPDYYKRLRAWLDERGIDVPFGTGFDPRIKAQFDEYERQRATD